MMATRVRSKRKRSPEVALTSPCFTGLQVDPQPASSTSALDSRFFSQPCQALSKALLGKIVVRQLADGTFIKGKIVETEAYPGEIDRASHSFKGRTERNAAMFDKAGTAYVYLIYGIYHCFNISALEPGAGVLIRALEPISGLDTIRMLRKGGTTMKLTELCNGPGRLCQAFNITTPVFNGHNLMEQRDIWLEDNGSNAPDIRIVEAKRVGIDSHGAEWAGKLWRYYIHGSPFVSKRDKVAEALLVQSSPEVSSIAEALLNPVAGGAPKSKRRKKE